MKEPLCRVIENDMKEDFYSKMRQPKALVSRTTRRYIFRGVVIAHIAVLVVPFLFLAVYEWFFKPQKPKIMQVTLYSPPPANPTPPAPQYTPPAPPKAKKKIPVKSKPKPKTAKPKPKTVKRKPKIKKAKVTKKRWKKASKIKISKEVVKVNRTTVKPKSQKRFIPLTPEQLKNRIYSNMPRIRTTNTANTALVQAYENKVGSYLYNVWETPDKSQLGNRQPEVEIELYVTATGKVSRSRITRYSGINPMDLSVKKLLAKLDYVPAPPKGATTLKLILEIAES
ncbi:TonB C-terminal domain-containing protein [Lentisphaerota bacterium ZTH]|nr:TonB C-terminal domain-containing protein [Lentisphaerota bacterium]WET06352.1 TonB C-terminal domain-containing protein [Lentisphaerota bacterium ZTH]